MSRSSFIGVTAARLWIAVIVWSVAFPSFALAQRLGQGSDVQVPWWRLIATLILCIGLAVGGAYALKARLRGAPALNNGARRLELVETLRLSHQIDICLLKCGDRALIVAATPQGLVELSWGEIPPVPPQ